MAASCLSISLSSSSSSIPKHKTQISSSDTLKKKQFHFASAHSVSFQFPNLSFSSLSRSHGTKNQKIRVYSSDLAVVNEESTVGEEEGEMDEDADVPEQEPVKKPRPCELYVCNIPRSHDIPQLLEMFKPFGTVLSVEVSRNPQTGESRGSGYVTMSSVNSAKKAVAMLDGTDVGGREMRVRFSVDMNPNSRRNPEVLNSAPKKILIYESPHKIYVGNLLLSIKPDELRNHFSQFGTVASVRVLHDRKAGKNRVFGFLSYSSGEERDAAVSLDGTVFQGRKIIVREGIERNEASD